MKHPDKHPESRRRFDTLPPGYSIRRLAHGISPGTSRKLTLDAQGALYEIAEARVWTEWGYGHATSMYTGACERRGYIEVAVPPGRDHHGSPVGGKFLYRATRAGVLIANEWRKERGDDPLPLPEGHVHEYGEWEHAGATMLGYEKRYCECGSFESRRDDARGEEWPENLTSWDLHEAILTEPDTERLRTLNAELRARLDGVQRIAVERVG